MGLTFLTPQQPQRSCHHHSPCSFQGLEGLVNLSLAFVQKRQLKQSKWHQIVVKLQQLFTKRMSGKQLSLNRTERCHSFSTYIFQHSPFPIKLVFSTKIFREKLSLYKIYSKNLINYSNK